MNDTRLDERLRHELALDQQVDRQIRNLPDEERARFR
jgi:hypothetical protein